METVLVIGGGGFYGRYLVADLLQHTNAQIIVASRKPSAIPSPDGRIVTVACDLSDLSSLKRVVAKSNVVVHCAGPFQYLPLNPLRAAIDAQVNYVDIAEDREFARKVQALSPECLSAGITVLNGISVVPGFAKQTSIPASRAVRIRLSAPFIAIIIPIP